MELADGSPQLAARSFPGRQPARFGQGFNTPAQPQLVGPVATLVQ